jgi:hypothetical protein
LRGPAPRAPTTKKWLGSRPKAKDSRLNLFFILKPKARRRRRRRRKRKGEGERGGRGGPGRKVLFRI